MKSSRLQVKGVVGLKIMLIDTESSVKDRKRIPIVDDEPDITLSLRIC